MHPQKITNSCAINLTLLFSARATKQFVRRTLTLGSFISICTYSCTRLIFHDVPFEFLYEAGMMLNLVFTGCLLVALLIGSFNILMFVADYYSKPIRDCSFAAAVSAVFKPRLPAMVAAEYEIFDHQPVYAIDKTGTLRYVKTKIPAIRGMDEPVSENEPGAGEHITGVMP